MPLSPNLLLQAGAQAKAPSGPANISATPAVQGDKPASFARMFADQKPAKAAPGGDAGVKPLRDKATDAPGKQEVDSDKSAAAATTLADSGKTLPDETHCYLRVRHLLLVEIYLLTHFSVVRVICFGDTLNIFFL